ncbi:MAG: hypothetical protein ACRC5R_05640 [Mycoplasmatales bacterium]
MKNDDDVKTVEENIDHVILLEKKMKKTSTNYKYYIKNLELQTKIMMIAEIIMTIASISLAFYSYDNESYSSTALVISVITTIIFLFNKNYFIEYREIYNMKHTYSSIDKFFGDLKKNTSKDLENKYYNELEKTINVPDWVFQISSAKSTKISHFNRLIFLFLIPIFEIVIIIILFFLFTSSLP